MTQHIGESCVLFSGKLLPTTLYEDNTTCITQIKRGYIKSDRKKHISLKFVYTHDLEENDNITIQQICSRDNLTNLFTKPLPTTTFEKVVHNIRMYSFYFCKCIWNIYSFSFARIFFIGVFSSGVLTRHISYM